MGEKISDKKRQSFYILISVIVLLAYIIFFYWNPQGMRKIDELLDEPLKTNILLCIAAAGFLIMLWKYIKKSEHAEIPTGIPVPVESKWKEEFGNTIKTWKTIMTSILLIILLVFMGTSAIYVTIIIYFSMNLAQYILLTPKLEIHNDMLAIFMILAFLVIIIVWSQINIFFPGGAALFFVFFLCAFIWLFYGGRIDEVHWWFRHRKK